MNIFRAMHSNRMRIDDHTFTIFVDTRTVTNGTINNIHIFPELYPDAGISLRPGVVISLPEVERGEKVVFRDTEERVNHPPHYGWHPTGVESIDISEEFTHNLGAAIDYIWRCDHKGHATEDLEKAIWYLNREIERRCKRAKLTKEELKKAEGTAR